MNPLKTKSLQKVAVLCFVLVLGFQGAKAQQLLTLEKALELAETTSPTIVKSKLSIVRQQKSLEAQRAALRSNFSLSVTGAQYDKSRAFSDERNVWYTTESFSTGANFRVTQPILLTDGTLTLSNNFSWQSKKNDLNPTQAPDIFRNALSLSFDQPLFTYNRLKVTLRQLELNLENANMSYAMQRLNMEKSVTQQFYSVYVQQENLAIAEAELENTQKNYDLIKSKADAGLVALEELYQAELNLMQSKSSVNSSKVTYENAKDQLKQSLGMDIYEDFTILNVDIAAQQQVDIDLDKAIEGGLERRMEIRQREIDIENGEFSMLQVKAQNEFNGTLGLKLGITGDDNKLGNVYKSENTVNNPSVSVTFNVPVFDWGEKKAKIAAQEASMESTKIDYDEQKKTIILSIREAYRSMQSQWDQIAIAELSRKNAELTYAISQERYSNGQITSMDMNLQTQQYTSAQISYTQSQINYRLELLNLKIQTLFDYETNTPVIPQDLYLNDNN